MWRSCKLTGKVYFHDTYRTSFVPFVAEIQTSWTWHLKLCLSFWVPEFAFAEHIYKQAWPYPCNDMAYDRSRLFIENLRCSPIIVVPMTRNTDLSRPYPVYFGLFWHSVQLAHMSPWFCLELRRFLHDKRSPPTAFYKGWNQKKKGWLNHGWCARVWSLDCSLYDVFWWRKTKWTSTHPSKCLACCDVKCTRATCSWSRKLWFLLWMVGGG